MYIVFVCRDGLNDQNLLWTSSSTVVSLVVSEGCEILAEGGNGDNDIIRTVHLYCVENSWYE